MIKLSPYLESAAFGAMSGMRTWSSVAFISQRLAHSHGEDEKDWPLALLARPAISATATLIAVTEVIADKLPILPDRTDPIPLAGRIAFGAFAGRAWASHRRGSKMLGVALGGLGAAAASFAGLYLRRRIARGLRVADPVVAVVEDALVIAVGLIATGGRNEAGK